MPMASPELISEIQALQAKEIRLLQTAQYDQWLHLFTEDLRYWMPVTQVENRRDAETERHELGHFDDNLETLSLRVKRLSSSMAWTEIPPSRVRYFLQPIHVDVEENGQLELESNFLIYQTRLQRDENFFVGCRYDTLRRVDGHLRICSRKIVADKTVISAKNLTIFF